MAVSTISVNGLIPATQDIIYAPPSNWYGTFTNIRIIAMQACNVTLWKRLETEDPVLLMSCCYEEGDWSDDDTRYELKEKEVLMAETDGNPDVTFVMNGEEREVLL